MQAAAAIAPANNGKVGCTPMLGNIKPTAPAVNMAANVASHLRSGIGWGIIAAAYDEPALVVDLIKGFSAHDSVE